MHEVIATSAASPIFLRAEVERTEVTNASPQRAETSRVDETTHTQVDERLRARKVPPSRRAARQRRSLPPSP